MNYQISNFSKEMETMLKLKSPTSQMQNSLDGLSSKKTKGRLSEPVDRSIQTTHTETQRKNGEKRRASRIVGAIPNSLTYT